MSSIKPEVAEFDKLLEEDSTESGRKAFVMMFKVLVDIRDLLMKS